MTLYGLTGNPSRYSLQLPAQGRGSCTKRVPAFPDVGKSTKLTYLQRNNWAASIQRCSIQKAPISKCAMDASFGDTTNDSNGRVQGTIGLSCVQSAILLMLTVIVLF